MNPLPPSIIYEQDKFLAEVKKRLGEVELDYTESYKEATTKKPRLLAGTLLLLTEAPIGRESTNRPDFHFLLIKRSHLVSQSGDLGSPGGILQPVLDRFLRLLIVTGIIPILRGVPRQLLESRDKRTFFLTTLFLANALRETREEIGLKPGNILFLGALPTYPLTMFARTIFPLIAMVKNRPLFKLNHEVGKIVSIPLSAFFQEENYGLLNLQRSGCDDDKSSPSANLPCFIYQDEDGQEVLWGATYQIVIFFLKLFFLLPDQGARRPVIRKILDHNYLHGTRQSKDRA